MHLQKLFLMILAEISGKSNTVSCTRRHSDNATRTRLLATDVLLEGFIVEGVLLEVELAKINGVHDLRILSALTNLYITHLPLGGGRYAVTYGVVVF